MLDLSDLGNWSDEDVMASLNDIEGGLTDNQVTWVERFNHRIEDRGSLSNRQREIAEDILMQWNDKQ